jgi:hypothetical protein
VGYFMVVVFLIRGFPWRAALSMFTAFEPFGLLPAMRAAARKNESSRFAFFSYRKGGESAVGSKTVPTIPIKGLYEDMFP